MHQWYGSCDEDCDNPHEIVQVHENLFVVENAELQADRCTLERALYLAGNLPRARQGVAVYDNVPFEPPPPGTPVMRHLRTELVFGKKRITTHEYQSLRLDRWPEKPDEINVVVEVTSPEDETEIETFKSDIALAPPPPDSSGRQDHGYPLALLASAAGLPTSGLTDILTWAYTDPVDTNAERCANEDAAYAMAVIAIKGRKARLDIIEDLIADHINAVLPEAILKEPPVTVTIDTDKRERVKASDTARVSETRDDERRHRERRNIHRYVDTAFEIHPGIGIGWPVRPTDDNLLKDLTERSKQATKTETLQRENSDIEGTMLPIEPVAGPYPATHAVVWTVPGSILTPTGVHLLTADDRARLLAEFDG